MMTAKAVELGMTDTVFRNASGLPDDSQVTTALDMAILSRALIYDHPRHYHYFSIGSFEHKGKVYESHNRLLRFYPGADRSEEHTSELQSLMRISYAVFCLKKKNKKESTQTSNKK